MEPTCTSQRIETSPPVEGRLPAGTPTELLHGLGRLVNHIARVDPEAVLAFAERTRAGAETERRRRAIP